MKNGRLGTDIKLQELGWPYGLDGDLAATEQGDLAVIDDIENVRQALFKRLNTPKGELWAHPSYGNGAFTILSETIDDNFLVMALDAVRECINAEPRVRLLDINQQVYPADRIITYTVTYEVLKDTRTDNLVFTIDAKKVMASA